MRAYKATLLAGVAVAVMSGPALATDDKKGFTLKNAFDKITIVEDNDKVYIDIVDEVVTKLQLDQVNDGDIHSSLNVVVEGADWVEATSVAIANNASATVNSNLGAIAWQENHGDVSASMNAELWRTHGATATAIAIANNVSLTLDDYAGGVATVNQENTGSVDAYIHGHAKNSSDVALNAIAIANNATLNATGNSLLGGVNQSNWGHVTASTSAKINDVSGSASASAIAIGNNVSVVNKFNH